MNFKEKLAMSKEKTEELKAKIAASAENAKKAHEAKKDEIKSNIDELNAEIDEFEKEFDDELEAGASLAIEEAAKLVVYEFRLNLCDPHSECVSVYFLVGRRTDGIDACGFNPVNGFAIPLCCAGVSRQTCA